MEIIVTNKDGCFAKSKQKTLYNSDRDDDGDPDALDCGPDNPDRFHGNDDQFDGVDSNCVSHLPSINKPMVILLYSK